MQMDPIALFIIAMFGIATTAAPLLAVIALWRIGSYLRDGNALDKRAVDGQERMERLIADKSKL
jgi:hypothetical protein